MMQQFKYIVSIVEYTGRGNTYVLLDYFLNKKSYENIVQTKLIWDNGGQTITVSKFFLHWLSERSATNLNTCLATRSHYPAQVMVWAAVTADGRSPLVLLEPDVKINAINYREMDLEGFLKPWARKHFGSRPWTFQQDSAPSHKAGVNQDCLRENVPHFITVQQWLSIVLRFGPFCGAPKSAGLVPV